MKNLVLIGFVVTVGACGTKDRERPEAPPSSVPPAVMVKIPLDENGQPAPEQMTTVSLSEAARIDDAESAASAFATGKEAKFVNKLTGDDKVAEGSAEQFGWGRYGRPGLLGRVLHGIANIIDPYRVPYYYAGGYGYSYGVGSFYPYGGAIYGYYPSCGYRPYC